jgi:hypothetical protein
MAEHTDPWPSTALCPTRENIQVGDWLVLRCGWIVGPVVSTEYDTDATYVGFTDGVWQVDTVDQDDALFPSHRTVMFAGTLQHACEYRRQVALADKVIAELIEEENGAAHSTHQKTTSHG